MRNEVNPAVLKVVDDILASHPKFNIVTELQRLRVPDAREKRGDYVWTLPGGGFLVSVWAEFIYMHRSERWFCVEPLDTKTLPGGAAKNPNQEKRSKDRVAALQQMHSRGQDCSAVLQLNDVSIERLNENKSAEVDFRVKDRERWHVARWDTARGRAVLVRGDRNWAPTDAEVDEHIARGPLGDVPGVQEVPAASPAAPAQVEPPPEAEPPEPKLWFPDQAHRDAVDAAAMKHMTAVYESRGLVVHDVSDKDLGYDLQVDDATGNPVQLVEVKGTSTPTEGFYLTRNERRCAKREPAWRLAAVTNALTAPIERVYSALEMEEFFSFEPLVWRCDTKA